MLVGSMTQPPFQTSAAWGEDGPTFFDLAMGITMSKVQELDERQLGKFVARLDNWASKPPPDGAKTASSGSQPGNRFVGLLTTIARRAVMGCGGEDDQESLFCEGMHKGLARLVKYWGPGHKYPQRCPIRYAAASVKSACSNAKRKHHADRRS